MGSSGGGSYQQPNIPKPPSDMIAGPGQTSPFNPQYVNFLGDTNVPSTGLTPDMLAQIDSGVGRGPPPQPSMGGLNRDMLSQLIADLMKGQQQQGGGGMSMAERQRQYQQGNGGGRASGAGYSTSGREGAGGFGSRSSSASRAGGGLY